MKNIANNTSKSEVRRGTYQEILLSSLNKTTRKQVETLVYAASNAEKIDEHGSWEFGGDFDRKGRGSALNWDLYGISRDYHSKRTLIVIQVRQFIRRRKNYFPEIKKSYFLIGRNEDKTVFAHPVESRVVQAAARAGKDVVRAVQNWIFGVDYKKIIRQGDICLIPLRSKAVLATASDIPNQFTIQDSHLIKAETVKMNGGNNVYAFNPSLYHLPKTHPNFEELKGWFKVMVGRRSDFYSFAAPTID